MNSVTNIGKFLKNPRFVKSIENKWENERKPGLSLR